MNLLLTRDYGGIGDWLMSLAVLKLVNRQRPDVAVHVSFDTSGEPLPAIVPQAFEASDVAYAQGLPQPPYSSTGHFVYSAGRGKPPFIPDMLRVLRQRTGIAIEHEQGIYPIFDFAPRAAVALPWRARPGYVVMISQGKSVEPRRKEWGSANFQRLAELVAQRHDVVQIGASTDEPLQPASERWLGATFQTVASVLAGARAFIGIENGMMVLAGFLGVPQITVYCGYGAPDRLLFDRQTQVRDAATPEAVAELLV